MQTKRQDRVADEKKNKAYDFSLFSALVYPPPFGVMLVVIALPYITENSTGGTHKDPNVTTPTLPLHCGDNQKSYCPAP